MSPAQVAALGTGWISELAEIMSCLDSLRGQERGAQAALAHIREEREACAARLAEHLDLGARIQAERDRLAREGGL